MDLGFEAVVDVRQFLDGVLEGGKLGGEGCGEMGDGLGVIFGD
jgi:hypothetical protein